MKAIHTLLTMPAVIAACFRLSFSYPAYNACPNAGSNTLTDEDFRSEVLVSRISGTDYTLTEPIEMVFDPVYDNAGDMFVNIYFVERAGNLKFYDAQTKKVTVIGVVDAVSEQSFHSPGVEDGLVGIVWDPDYKQNHRMFLYYSPRDKDVFRVSRFTLVNNQLDLASEKPILEIEVQQEDCCHTGGSMKFDDYGDLWITVGNNIGRYGSPPNMDETTKIYSDEWGASSSASLRGGLLRIRPMDIPDNETPAPGPGATYTIPSGNYCEFFSDLSLDYRDPAKCRAENYAKGFRNAYTLTLDPVRRWAAIGDCSSDMGDRVREEHTVLLEPGFHGWPYFAADNVPAYPHTEGMDPNNIRNLSRWNEGAEIIPPAVPATHPYKDGCAMTGPIYRYDPDLKSPVKFPPHFDRKWFLSDWNSQGFIKTVGLNEKGDAMAGTPEEVLTEVTRHGVLDMEMGPDGALYILNYGNNYFGTDMNTSIVKVEYTGNCHPSFPDFPKLEKAGCTDPGYLEYDPQVLPAHHNPAACITPTTSVSLSQMTLGRTTIQSGVLSINDEGTHAVTIADLNGKTVFEVTGKGPARYSLSDIGTSGVYFLKIAGRNGTVSRKFLFQN